MDPSNSSTACAAPLTPTAIAASGLAVVLGAQPTPMKRQSSRRQRGQGQWRNLLWLLLLGGLTEASMAQISVAQNSTTAEPAIVQIQEQGVEPADAGKPPTPQPEAIVIPDAPIITNPSATVENAAENAVKDAVTEAIDKAQELDPANAETGKIGAEELPPAPTIETPRDRRPSDSPVIETTSEPETTSAPEVTSETEATSESEVPSETEAVSTETDRVYLANQQISFVPPIGFTPMSPMEIESKFPGAMPPQYAYGNAARDVSVGVSVSNIPLTPDQLPEVKTFLEEYLETSVPGFQWLEHDFVNLGGQDWIKLEFLSEAPEQRIHNDMYITSLQGKLLGFNFNANLAVDATLRPLLQDSRNSIVVDTTVATDEGR